MMLQYNIKDKRAIKRLRHSKRFPKYPDMFLGNTCRVRVNRDDFLIEDEFVIQSKYSVLPRNLFIYGKKERNCSNDNIYMNYWMETFLKTIENGIICKYDVENSTNLAEMSIGLSRNFRQEAFMNNYWNRANVIKFLQCLFNVGLFEINYEQQDLFGELAA